MRRIKVKAYKRKGKKVRSHTRRIKKKARNRKTKQEIIIPYVEKAKKSDKRIGDLLTDADKKRIGMRMIFLNPIPKDKFGELLDELED